MTIKSQLIWKWTDETGGHTPTLNHISINSSITFHSLCFASGRFVFLSICLLVVRSTLTSHTRDTKRYDYTYSLQFFFSLFFHILIHFYTHAKARKLYSSAPIVGTNRMREKNLSVNCEDISVRFGTQRGIARATDTRFALFSFQYYLWKIFICYSFVVNVRFWEIHRIVVNLSWRPYTHTHHTHRHDRNATKFGSRLSYDGVPVRVVMHRQHIFMNYSFICVQTQGENDIYSVSQKISQMKSTCRLNSIVSCESNASSLLLIWAEQMATC